MRDALYSVCTGSRDSGTHTLRLIYCSGSLLIRDSISRTEAGYAAFRRKPSVQLALPPKTAAIYVPDDSQPNYAFFKPRILGGNGP